MEKDLESQVESQLTRLLTEQLVSPAGKLTLSRWFIDKLEAERRGWKGRLRDASRATDSEHRLALASQAIIQRVSQQMKDRMTRQQDQTSAADGDNVDNDDVDKRMERLLVIERNWEAVSAYIDKLERDRTDCLQVGSHVLFAHMALNMNGTPFKTTFFHTKFYWPADPAEKVYF